ncbi:MAG: M23 family metallopeptidase, partial [Dinghuibacter sp.]|nr:M23 family metallopeptidase [Dinghuibacter sp.]
MNSRFRKILKTGAFVIVVLLVLLVAAFFIVTRLSSRVTENLDSYTYNLPYAPGAGYKVVQGYGGWFSHKNIAAIDFSMPVGTPVHAAREGVVYSYKSDSNEGGPWPKYKNKANYLMIKHADGSIACYWHLQKNGVVVKSGQVAKGQLIGYSGATGFVLRPHLHFSVKRKLNYEMNSFVRTRFNTSNGIQLLKRGNTY